MLSACASAVLALAVAAFAWRDHNREALRLSECGLIISGVRHYCSDGVEIGVVVPAAIAGALLAGALVQLLATALLTRRGRATPVLVLSLFALPGGLVSVLWFAASREAFEVVVVGALIVANVLVLLLVTRVPINASS